MVLVASLCVPALAVATVLDPDDYISAVYRNDDLTVDTYFRFHYADLYRVYREDTLEETFKNDMDWYYDGTESSYYRVRYYPLGAVPSTVSATGAVIDVSDFKSQSTISIAYTMGFQLDFAVNGDSNLTFTTNSVTTLYWYDADFNYLTNSSSSSQTSTVPYSDPQEVWLFHQTVDMTIPSNACYFSVMVNCRINDPDNGALLGMRSTHDTYFALTVRKDTVLENSETMQRIEEELEDLNDKADIIINGTPEMDAIADEYVDDVDKQRLTLDEFRFLSGALEQDFDVWSDTAWEKLSTFVEGVGWTQLGNLLSPIMDWEHMGYIMFMVIAFVNLSVILFGR